MDIRAIVESTLVAPMREQAAALQFESDIAAIQKNLDAKQNEIQRLDSLCAWYRTQNAQHERTLGQLLKLLKADELDAARDLAQAEFDAIHGPNE
jgi:hypothetical protein